MKIEEIEEINNSLKIADKNTMFFNQSEEWNSGSFEEIS